MPRPGLFTSDHTLPSAAAWPLYLCLYAACLCLPRTPFSARPDHARRSVQHRRTRRRTRCVAAVVQWNGVRPADGILRAFPRAAPGLLQDGRVVGVARARGRPQGVTPPRHHAAPAPQRRF